jgi:hypothetical protein
MLLAERVEGEVEGVRTDDEAPTRKARALGL